MTVLVNGVPVAVAVAGSIGSIMVEPDENLDLALRRADAAMYIAKRGANGSHQDAGVRLRH